MSWSSRLRSEVTRRAKQYAINHAFVPYQSLGKPPAILFKSDLQVRQHGNFLQASYRAILEEAAWNKQFETRPPYLHNLPIEEREHATDLDTAVSSDALLMNIFCYPALLEQAGLQALLGGIALGRPQFGVAGNVPLMDGTPDMTEVDMRIGDLLFESKLTESDFTAKAKVSLNRYRDFHEVFETLALPQTTDDYLHYQLLRNVLAAFDQNKHFILLCDARRPDLLQAWWRVMRCVKAQDLRLRCQFILWQEIAAVAPDELKMFLKEKYGIRSTEAE